MEILKTMATLFRLFEFKQLSNGPTEIREGFLSRLQCVGLPLEPVNSVYAILG